MLAYKVLVVLLVASYVYAAAFPGSTQTAILDRHNAKRSGVNPTASNMVPLVWNSTLADFASNYIAGCVFQHSYAAGMGENLYASMSSQGSPAESLVGPASVDSWDSEKAYYTLSSNTCQSNQVCGHYTQVVWANTRSVGCGYAYCSGGWTYVSCNYYPPGNWNNEKPYIAGSSSSSCTPTCPTGQCGTVTSCNQQVSCPACPTGQYCNGNTCTACPNPCSSGSCGLRSTTTCPSYSVDCGSCGTGQTCSSNTCVAASCSAAQISSACSAIGKNCGTWSTSSCGSVNCGSCASGSTCTSGTCVTNPPCGGSCSSPSQTCNTASNTCACASGYTLVNNVCTAQSGGPASYSSDFTTISGTNTLTVPSTSLNIGGTTPSIVKYNRGTGFINKYWTKLTAEVTQTTGTFGIGWRVGQGNYVDDGLYIFATNIGTNNFGFRWDWKYGGSWYSPTPSVWTIGSNYWRTSGSVIVSSWLTTNDTTQTTTVYFATNSNGWTATYSFYTNPAYVSNTGNVAIYSTRTGSTNTGITKFTLATSTTLSVSLYSCISDTDWVTLFFQLTGAPAGTTVTARPSGTNARCKAAGAKEAASAFIVVIESSTIASEAIATNFLAAVESGSAAAAPLAVKSAAIIGGAEGAALAGLPEVAAVAVAAPGAAGGGGAAGGLSGGAIAGIVVGSVAGAVLIVGVAAIVVAAVVVAAVVVAKKSSDDSDSGPSRADPEQSKRGSIRNTIHNIFRSPRGGVDVMNNPKGHQSITARAPPLQH